MDNFSPVNNPFSGQINYLINAKPGEHYQLAADYWRSKPLVNGTMFHFAYLANSLFNGKTVAIDRSTERNPLGHEVKSQIRYVELSPNIKDGAYNLQDYTYPFFERRSIYGYSLPSQNEWIKAAYFAPKPTDNGTNYFYYPTSSNQEATPLSTAITDGSKPTVDELGRVIPENLQPSLRYSNTAGAVLWQPPYAPGNPPQANVVDVGASATPSPWNTYDQGGNVVEYTDTAVPVVAGLDSNPNHLPVFVKVHGGIANADQYQLWISSTGTSSPYGQSLGATDTQGGGRLSYRFDPLVDPLIGPLTTQSASNVFDPLSGISPVYRQDNLKTLDTFYTSNIREAIQLDQSKSSGYVFLGASFGQQPASSAAKAVYRFFYEPTGTHFYTINPKEAAVVNGIAGYRDEGVGFVAFDPGVASVDFRRFYNSTTGAHAFSAANADIEFFTSRGYTLEGLSWSAVL